MNMNIGNANAVKFAKFPMVKQLRNITKKHIVVYQCIIDYQINQSAHAIYDITFCFYKQKEKYRHKCRAKFIYLILHKN